MSTQPAPVAAARPPLVLSERERELVLLLRSIDFFRAGKTRQGIIWWNGVRLILLDGVQVGSCQTR